MENLKLNKYGEIEFFDCLVCKKKNICFVEGVCVFYKNKLIGMCEEDCLEKLDKKFEIE